MKLCSMIINEIKAVYQYEKRSRVDIGTLQNVMLIFVVVMLLIDIQNLKLGEYRELSEEELNDLMNDL